MLEMGQGPNIHPDQTRTGILPEMPFKDKVSLSIAALAVPLLASNRPNFFAAGLLAAGVGTTIFAK